MLGAAPPSWKHSKLNVYRAQMHCCAPSCGTAPDGVSLPMEDRNQPPTIFVAIWCSRARESPAQQVHKAGCQVALGHGYACRQAVGHFVNGCIRGLRCQGVAVTHLASQPAEWKTRSVRCRQLRQQGRQRHLRRRTHTHTSTLAGAIQSVQTCILHAATCPVLIVLRHCCLQRPQRRQRVCLRLGVCGLAERVLHAEGRTPILRDWLGGGELCTGTIGRQRREPHCTTVASVATPAAVPESCLAREVFHLHRLQVAQWLEESPLCIHTLQPCVHHLQRAPAAATRLHICTPWRCAVRLKRSGSASDSPLLSAMQRMCARLQSRSGWVLCGG